MSEKKHIDRLFQEKLKDFEVAPSDAVWDRIHNQLHKDERERKIIPFWWKLAGVAALLAVLLTVGISLFSDDSNTTNTVVDTEKSSEETFDSDLNSNPNKDSHTLEKQSEDASHVANQENANESSEDNSEDANVNASDTYPVNNNTTSYPNSNTNRIVNNTEKSSKRTNAGKNVTQDEDTSEGNKKNSYKDAVVTVTKNNQNAPEHDKLDVKNSKADIDKLVNDSKTNVNSAVTDISKAQKTKAEDKKEESIEDLKKDTSIEDAIADANKENEEEKKLNRWNISPNVAPVYFNSLGKGSALDEQFVNNGNSSEVTMSYGVGGSYAINERLKVRAGINKVSLGYSTNNVIAFAKVEQATGFASSSNEPVHLSNVNINSSSENMVFLSSQTFNRSITPEVINSKSSGSIKQRFGFIEVPLEMEYAVINKTLGVNLIGGFSTLIVDENEIYSVFDGAETNIGEANNINNMSYSANFGLSINYNISEKIKVNVEPTFKYQINTFNNSSGDFQPYFIGLYTGFSYKF